MACLFSSSFLGTAAEGHRRDFAYTYDWRQPLAGEKELELSSHITPGGRSLEQIELEYGITNRLMAAPYVDYEQTSADGWRYAGLRLESRYQLGEFRAGAILPGLYAEFEKPSDGPGELELKAIFSRYGADGDDLSLNVLSERAVSGSGGPRLTASLGYSRDFTRLPEGRAGIELVRDLDTRSLNLGPVVAFSPGAHLWLVAGYGAPVGHSRHDVRLRVEYEWF